MSKTFESIRQGLIEAIGHAKGEQAGVLRLLAGGKAAGAPVGREVW